MEISTDTIRSLRNEERWLAGISALALATLLGAVEFLKPGHTRFLPGCLFQKFTGLLCPGCGTTRALYLLVHGQVLGAIHENALTVLLLPVLIHDIAAVLSGQWRSVTSRLSGRHIWILFGIVLLFTVARNVPLGAFAGLRPTVIP